MIVLNSDSAQLAAIEEIKSYPLDSKWAVVIEPYEKARSNQASRLFHKLCTIIASETGNDKDTIKDEIKLRAHGTIEREVSGVRLKELKSTADYTTEEMSRAIEVAYALGHELGMNLPLN